MPTREYYVPYGLEVKVKVGQKVEEGDVLSDGIVNPADIVKHKGIGEGRRYYAETLKNAFESSNLGVNRRNFELISKSAVNHVRIADDTPGLGDYLPGQVVTYEALEKNYKPRPGFREVRPDAAFNLYLEEPVLHFTIGTRITKKVQDVLAKHGVQSVKAHPNPPPFQPEMQRLLDVPAYEDDWMHQLYSTYLEKKLITGVNQGAKSDIRGPSPVPGLAFGVGFGKKPKVAEEQDYRCLLVPVSAGEAEKLKAWAKKVIPEDALSDKGYEEEPRVVVLRGFHDDVLFDEVREAVESAFSSGDFTLGNLSRLETPEHDVLKLDVTSELLQKLNKQLLKSFKERVANSNLEYQPYLPLAYVKPGALKNLDDSEDFAGKTFKLTVLDFCGPDGVSIGSINLTE
jgi:hypothetical protein